MVAPSGLPLADTLAEPVLYNMLAPIVANHLLLPATFGQSVKKMMVREALQSEHSIPDGWWLAQPAITAKSGWISHLAARTIDTRASMQVATCKLGIAIMKVNHHCDPLLGH